MSRRGFMVFPQSAFGDPSGNLWPEACPCGDDWRGRFPESAFSSGHAPKSRGRGRVVAEVAASCRSLWYGILSSLSHRRALPPAKPCRTTTRIR